MDIKDNSTCDHPACGWEPCKQGWVKDVDGKFMPPKQPKKITWLTRFKQLWSSDNDYYGPM